ncbi:MAG TPA: Phenylacetic acid catabolic protein [Polyangiaceae bacterium]|nr:Phenylacetic acid catabolic protein [Polyangiaceae bacterium]
MSTSEPTRQAPRSVNGPAEFEKMPLEYQELVIHQMMVHTEGELSGADDYMDLFYPMTHSAYEKKTCCERGAEEMDHYRKGAKILNDLGRDTAFMIDTPLQERNLYATEAVKSIKSWVERGFFSFLGEAAVLEVLKEMLDSSYAPIADMCPSVIAEEKVHVAHGLRIIRDFCETDEGRREAQSALMRWWPIALDTFGRSSSRRSPRYVKWGLRKFTNEEARTRFIAVTMPKVERLGLTVPEHTANRKFL